MATNRLPGPLDDLESLTIDAVKGAHQLGATVGLVQNTEVKISTDQATLQTTKNAHSASLSSRKPVYDAHHAAISNGRAYLMMARDNFKTFLGSQASQAWEAAGWTAHSIGIPSDSDHVLAILGKVKKFLTENPTRENEEMGLTAAHADALHTTLSDARNAVETKDNEIITKKGARDVAEKLLRKRLRGLIGELGQLLDPMDPRWLNFGLNRPGAPASPPRVMHVLAIPQGNQQLLVKCDAAARADYYQIWTMLPATETEYSLAESPRDPEKTLTGLPVGATIKVKMRAVNDTGYGQFSAATEAIIT